MSSYSWTKSSQGARATNRGYLGPSEGPEEGAEIYAGRSQNLLGKETRALLHNGWSRSGEYCHASLEIVE